MNEEISKGLYYYNKLNLSWCIEDLLKYNELGFLISDLIDKDNIQALLTLVCCGLTVSDNKRAYDIVEGWLKLFKSLDTLRLLIYVSLKDTHKFIAVNKDEDIEEDVFEKPPESKEHKDREEMIYDERQKLLSLLYLYIDIGFKAEEALKMDLKYFEYYKGYSINKREEKINDNLFIIHQLGMFVGIGVNNPTNYPDSVDNVKLAKKSKFEKIKELRESHRNFINRLKH